jgi:hypothetical protein
MDILEQEVIYKQKMEPKKKRQVLQLLDTFIEQDQLKKKTGT